MPLAPVWTHFPEMIPELEKVRSVIGRCIKNSPGGVRDELGRMLSKPGKMLRPAFTILASSWGSKQDNVTEVAAAVELLHAASLIHDDVLDKAEKRRGIKTIHRSLGVKKAILAGDYLLAQAMSLAASEFNQDFLPLFLNSINQLCCSEIDQDFNCFNMNIDAKVYLERIRGKTAELFGVACLAGGVSGRAPKAVCENFYRLGIAFGTAFQIEDDILDYTGKSGDMGKALGKDIRAGIPTLPLIEALKAEDPAISRLCSPLGLRLFPGSLRRQVVRKGYAEKAEQSAGLYRQEAMELLEALPPGNRKDLFRKIMESTKARKS